MKITLEWLKSQPEEVASNGREFRYNCPNCDDNSKHMYVNFTQSVWYCFKCGKGGKIESEQATEPSLEGFKLSKDIFGVGEVELVEKLERVKSLPVHKVLLHIEVAEDCESGDELTARNYLHSRGITQSEITKYGISLSLEKSGPYKKSIIFPVYSPAPSKHNLEYFVCRKYDNSKPKYVNAPWPKNDVLFLADAKYLEEPWVICEGIFDALAICRVGFNAIALLGKVPTSQQLKRLVERERYIIYLDEDAFSHAINLKLQLNAVGTKSQLLVHKIDAAQLYLEDTPLLRSLLDGAARQLEKYKKPKM